jgi:hypothetical protein
MALNTDYALSVDPTFWQKLAGALAKQSAVVAVEAGATANHANRLKFAQLVMGDATNQAQRYSLVLIEQFAWTSSTTDANLITNVASAWDALANAFVGV